MKPYPFTSNRFDADRYLDEQMHREAIARARSIEKDGWEARSTVLDPKQMAEIYRRYSDDTLRAEDICRGMKPPVIQHRGWAIRLNERCERWMDTIPWRRLDVLASQVCTITLTGFVIWLLLDVFDAWLQGRFNFGN
jgi:hypothetical protein